MLTMFKYFGIELSTAKAPSNFAWSHESHKNYAALQY
jgi:hypothetical protein